MDQKLKASLRRIADQIDKLALIEEVYLNLESSKKSLHGQLLLEKLGKTIQERNALVESSEEWKNFNLALNAKTSEFNRAKRWLDLLFEAHKSEYGSWIRDEKAIKHGVE